MSSSEQFRVLSSEQFRASLSPRLWRDVQLSLPCEKLRRCKRDPPQVCGNRMSSSEQFRVLSSEQFRASLSPRLWRDVQLSLPCEKLRRCKRDPPQVCGNRMRRQRMPDIPYHDTHRTKLFRAMLHKSIQITDQGEGSPRPHFWSQYSPNPNLSSNRKSVGIG